MKYKIGDIILWPGEKESAKIIGYSQNNYKYQFLEGSTCVGLIKTFDHNGLEIDTVLKETKGVKNMLKELGTDVRDFVKENRSVVYTVALVVLADHFLFGGAFRERIKAIVEKMLSKAEDKVAKVK